MQPLYIIFAWLMGLLSQPIVLRIGKHYKRKDLKKTIFSELKNLCERLVEFYLRIQMHLGIRDKSTLSWIKNIYEKQHIDFPKSISEPIDKLLLVPDEQFNNFVTSLSKADKTESLSFTTQSLPFIESILEHLSVFDLEFKVAFQKYEIK